MTKLEDYLSPSNQEEFLHHDLTKKVIEWRNQNPNKNLTDYLIDDAEISKQTISLDEVMELKSKNYPNAEINEGVRFQDWSLNTDNDHVENLKKFGYEFDTISKDDIEEEKYLAELGFKEWVEGIEDEEHYVDHEQYYFDPEWFKENRMKGEGETDSVTFDYSYTENEPNKLPDYLLNDPEIVGYEDEEMQEEIYEWVNSKLPKHNFLIKDLGCGRGDFFRVLIRHNGYSDDRIGIDYFGIDNNPNLIRVGKQKYPGINLIENDFNDISIQTDYTICIGTLNDDHGLDKWMIFNKTLNHALNNTKKAIIFVLQADCYGKSGHLDYPIHEVIEKLPKGTRFEIDNSKIEDIYCLTVHIGGYNN